MRVKLGLAEARDGDAMLANHLFEAMEGQQVDFTRFFRALAEVVTGDPEPARALFVDPTTFDPWLARWRERLRQEGRDLRTVESAMNAANPVYIPRNHKVEEALAAAVDGDMQPFQRFLEILREPYTRREGLSEYEEGAPEGAPPHVTFCGT